jgi:DNA-directed RNA polymerase subunit M/transcription elongation factor TFIIS/TM2 domain-containing membrane protein YozV
VIRFTCLGCERVVEVADDDAGLVMTCPTCGRRLQVPGAAAAIPVGPGRRAESSHAARPRLSAGDAPDQGMVAIQDCPECGKALQLPQDEVGRRVACPRCNREFVARGTTGRPRDEIDRDEDERVRRERRAREDDDRERRDRPPEDGERRPGGKYCTACGAAISQRDRYCPECDARQPETRDPALADANSKKIAAGICGILVGGLGVHKFVLGLTTPGVIMLLVSLLTCGAGWVVMHVIGLVEGIIYLTKSDADFHRTYMVEKKEWF